MNETTKSHAFTREDKRAHREELRRLAQEASATLQKVTDEAINDAVRKSRGPHG